MSVAADPTAEVKNFPGRDDLEKLLFSMLPSGWWEASSPLMRQHLNN